MVKDIGTEIRIINAARRVFLRKGMAGARMQEIADEAGINKALLHYYFRNKKTLFERIFNEVIIKISDNLKLIFEQEMDVLSRLCSIADVYIDTLLENSYLPLFVLNEMNQNPERLSGILKEHVVIHMGHFFEQILSETRAGKIRPVPPAHLLLNVLGLVIFPFAVYPMLSKSVSELLQGSLDNFLADRKAIVKQFIKDALTPQTQEP